MSAKRGLVVGLGVVVVVGGGVVWLMTTSGGGGGSVAGGSGVSVPSDDGAAGVDDAELVGLEWFDYESVRGALPGQLSGAEDEFVDALADTMLAYTLEDVNAYFEWQQDRGIVPVQRWVDDPENAQRYWDRGRRILADAQYDPGSVRVRRIRDRDDVGFPEDGGSYWAKRQSTRDDGRPFLAAGEPLSFEVVMRGRFPGEGGEVVTADLGVEMSWDPLTKNWVVSAIRTYHPVGPDGENAFANFDGSPIL